MSAILVRAKIATEIKTLSARKQRQDSAISQLATSNVSTEFLCVECVGKNLGIASAGAAGLKALVRVLQATMRVCPFWDFAIPFGRNGSTVLNGLLLAARTQLLR